MGTFLKYLFYLVLIVVIYLVGRGIYEGNINEQTSVGQVVDQVDSGVKNMATEAGNSVDRAVDDYRAETAAKNNQIAK